MRKFLTAIVILGFAGGALLGIFAMNHSQNSAMNGDCPVSPLHTSVCPAGALSMTSHYISMYQAFTNGIVSSVFQALMVVLLFVVVAYLLRRDITSIRHLPILSRNFDANLRRPHVVTRWLSLLINSPSFI